MAALALTLVALLGAASYRGSEAEEEAKAKGLVALAEVSGDFDGDGTADLGIVERDASGKCRAVVLTASGDDDEPDLARAFESSPKKCDRVLRLEAKPIAGERATDLFAELEEKSPDELVVHARIVGKLSGAFTELYAQSFPVAIAEDRVIELVKVKASLEVVDLDRDGTQELLWVRGPRLLPLKAPSGIVQVVFGVEKQVFRFRADEGKYAKADEVQVEDLLPPKKIWEAVASAQAPDVKTWGTAQAFWASDEDNETAWTLTGAKHGVGETLELKLARPTSVGLVRIVPGCARSVDAWKRGAQVTKLKIELGSVTLDLDRDKLLPPATGVRAVSEFPLPGGFGDQLIFLLSEPQKVGSVRLTIKGISLGSDKSPGAETCISEIGLHG
ncbi:MAG: hypothetical protein HYV07_18470 [Deltaproteobacteria bacterium]|nr:hypothetical protein [Deltaproteobacteria bacterium]